MRRSGGLDVERPPADQESLWRNLPPNPYEEEDLPPLEDWPPPEIKARWAERRERERQRRSFRRKALLSLVVIAALIVGAMWVDRRAASPHKRASGPAGPRPELLAWSVDLGFDRLVTVVAVPANGPPVAVAIPGVAQVDIPGGGPPTIDAATLSPALMVAGVQAALDRKVDHYVASDASTLMTLVDELGGVQVEAESSFLFQGQSLGPGTVRLTGGAVLAYLESGQPEDLTARWEDVLAGIFSVRGERATKAWADVGGQSDALATVRTTLQRAAGALVLELPTAPTPEGAVAIDTKSVSDLVQRNFGGAGGQLVRVVLLNGTGRGGLGSDVSALLAPAGFRIVAAQEAAQP